MNLLVSGQALTKSYGLRPLFTQLSLGFSVGERVGLVGPNGAGKSTLLKILAGLEESDAGTIAQNRQAEIVYLPQDEKFPAEKTVEECLIQHLPEHSSASEQRLRIQSTLRTLNFTDPEQKVGILSGGWRKRLALGQALIQQPDLLLLDEPTNHLDLEGVLWLEQLLREASFAFVVVSHDRAFLQETTNQTLELNKSYPNGFLRIDAPYEVFQERKAEFLLNQQQQQSTLANKVRREEEWLRRGPKARTTKARFRSENAAQLQQELQKLRELNSQNRNAAIEFEGTERKTKKLIEVLRVSFAYGENQLFSQLNLQLTAGMCLGVLGKNGSGKSSLLQLLKRTLLPQQGEVRWAEGLRVVHFDQHRQQLPLDQTLRQALAPAGDTVIYQGRSLHVAAWAQRFLFPKEKLTLPLRQLSGGERARVLIANLMLQPADVLLLDEPTNDLDIPTLEVLEESLAEFPGAVLLITHDRYLMDRLSDLLLCLNGDGTVDFFADYSQWKAQQKTADIPPAAKTPHHSPAKKMSYEERKEWQRMEGRIEKAEAEVTRLQEQLHDPEYVQDLQRLQLMSQELQSAEEKVQQLYERWSELEELASEN